MSRKKLAIKNKSWYKTEYLFSKPQQGYLDLLERNFQVKDPLGRPIPYHMTDYQKEYHAKSINVKGEEAKDILFIKARGISFTISTMMDLIWTALSFNNQLIPVIAQRYDSACEIINAGKWLIKNMKDENLKKHFKLSETEIKCTITGSVIKPFPSHAAVDAIRGVRLITALVDEFAFQQKDTELLAAVQDTMQSSYGQIKIGSTPHGRNNLFFKLVKKPSGFIVFNLPLFKPGTFDVEKPIPEQNLIPIAPWFDMNKLEKKRKRDKIIFRQEYLNDFLDDSISLIPYAVIERCNRKDLVNYATVLKNDPTFVYQTTNPITIGVDVAEKTDFFAVSAFEHTTNEDGAPLYIQKYLDYFNGWELPKLQEYLERVLGMFPTCLKCRIDMTGMGLGLFQYTKKKKGCIIEGIHFASRIPTAEHRQKAKVREYMCINLKGLMENNQVLLIKEEMQTSHLGSMNHAFKVEQQAEKGHGDILFANAMALLPLQYKNLNVTPLITNIDIRPTQEEINKQPIILSVDNMEFKERKHYVETWGEKIKRLRRNQRR